LAKAFSYKTQSLTYYLPILAVIIGIAITIAIYYPGIMTFDAAVQLEQARSGLYTDNHPPIMAWLWSILDKLIPGSGGLFLFHILLFWVGWGIFISLYSPNRPTAALMILLLGLFPSVFGLLPTVSKDISLGTTLVFICSLIALADKLNKALPLVISLLFFFYASSVRHNSSSAIIPLIIWAAVILHKITAPRVLKRNSFVILVTLAAFLGLQGMTRLTNHLLTKGKSSFLVQHVFLFDLVGISLIRGEVRLPSYLNRPDNPWTIQDFEKIFNPAVSDTIFQGSDPPRRFSYSQNKMEIEELRRYWIGAVTSDLSAYLTHRWNLFKYLIGFTQGRVCNPLGTAISYDPLNKNWLNKHEVTFLKDISNSIIFRGWFYLSIAFFLLLYSLLLKSGEAFLISLSGWLHGSFYFIVSPSCHFRYLWWTVLSTMLAAVVIGGHIYPKVKDFRSRGPRGRET